MSSQVVMDAIVPSTPVVDAATAQITTNGAATAPVVQDAAGSSDPVSDMSNRILEIIYEYALNKFEETSVKHAAGHPKFMAVVNKFVAEQKTVLMCLPAFPFKSANKAYKVFGILPDKAEEIALDRLNSMCKRITAIYPPGAQLTIISDGLVYNDLLCIPDRDVWAYGQALRAMAVEKGFTHIEFSRLRDLTEIPLPEKLEEIVYVANATNFRRHMLNRWGRDDINVDDEIANNPDTLMTYRGYSRFLESDLKHVFPSSSPTLASGKMAPGMRSVKAFKRDVKYLGKQMIMRGYAFAGACKHAFPNHLRLSIHMSTGEHKISMSLLDTKTGYTTPWHCSVAQLASGEWISAPLGDFKTNPRMEVVYENGRPSYFRERPEPIAEIAATSVPAGDGALLSEPQVPTATSSSTPSVGGDDSGSDPIGSSTTLSDASCSASVNLETPAEEKEEIAVTCGCQSDLKTKDVVVVTTTEITTEETVAPQVSTASNEYGKRLIPHIIDDLALNEPDRVTYSIVKSADVSQGMTEISAKAMAQAVNKAAWWLQSQIGETSESQMVGYIGPHDLRYVVLTYACIKAGHQILFMSPKNSVDGAMAVLNAANCNFWAQPSEEPLSFLVEKCLEKRAMSVLNVPTVDELLDAADVKHFPYNKTWEEAENDIYCVLHTSGSTGLPKPIRWTHGLIGTMDAVRLLPPAEGDMGLAPWTTMFEDGDRIYSSFPMSHGAGTIMNSLIPAYFRMHCVMGPSGVIPNMDLTASLADHAKLDVWSIVPSLVDQLGETPEVLAKFKSAKFICASGGPVSPVSAGKVNEVVRVLNLTGTTEGLFIGNLVTEREDWHWFAFHPYSGFEFRQIGDTNEYEHWVVRNQYAPLFQGIFHTFPDKTEINLKDLYVKHPTKPDHWAFSGRSDDVVVLSNGYKISPLNTEALITSHPDVDGCLLVGTGQAQAGLLIELADPATKLPASKELLDSIYEYVLKANSMSLHKDQLHRDYIMFAEPDKPFVRTDKRTIKRKDTLDLYADYIQRYYTTADREQALTLSLNVDSSSADSIAAAVREVISSVITLPPDMESVPDTADLFNLGLDSLRVFQLVRALQGAIPELQDLLAPRHLYANPTIAKFAAVVARLVEGAQSGAGDVEHLEKVNKMKELLNKYKTRSSLKMTEYDQMMPQLYGKMLLYFPLKQGVTFEAAFSQLQEGLARTIRLVPTLDYKVAKTPETAPGYRPGQVELVAPEPEIALTEGRPPRQLTFRDLSKELPSFSELKAAHFVHPSVTEARTCDAAFYPSLPAESFLAQANFIEGGMLLVMCFHHSAYDGSGVVAILRAWGENCRFLQGDSTATCSWVDPESSNRSLMQAIFEAEGHAATHKPDGSDIPASVWDHIPFVPASGAYDPAANTGHPIFHKPLSPAFREPPAPDARQLETTIFCIPAEKIAQLEAHVASDPAISPLPTPPSISDIIQALFWRATVRARHAVASQSQSQPIPLDTPSILEIAVDGRAYFSTLLPSTYMGNLMLFNRLPLPLSDLITADKPNSSGSIAAISQKIRSSASLINAKLFHDAYALSHSPQVSDYSQFKYAFMRHDGFDLAITNLMLFETGEVLAFGKDLFEDAEATEEEKAKNKGGPAAMRMPHGVQNSAHRLVVIFPLRKDGGVEILVGTFPEEKEAMLKDEEWMAYAQLM
ncbi:acetyl-CoA synthetase-like protein [Naviculisporaceae sp. PSN 640]